MKEVLMYLVHSLVDDSNSVKITTSEAGEIVRFKLTVAASDRGKIIGKEGRVIKSIRSILHMVASKSNRKVYLDVV